MKCWRILNDTTSAEVWNNYLRNFKDYTVFQLYEWGEHRRSFGWTPFRCVAYNDDNEIVGMVQVLYRRYPFGVGSMWSSGGPVGDISYWDRELRELLLERSRPNGLYIRIFSNRKMGEQGKNSMISKGWKPCNYKLRSGLSMKLNLDRNLDEIHTGLSRNWRRNLKRSKKSDLTIRQWFNPNIDEIKAVYKSMEAYKGLKERSYKQEFESMFQKLGNRIVLYRCFDEKGQVVALRGCAILHRFGWDLLAATTELGRNLYASYALVWKLLQHCQKLGVVEYDFMGIDPKKNSGVYNFKKGTGAEFIEYLGEWDWATNSIIRWGANIMVHRLRSND